MTYILVTQADMSLLRAHECAILHGEDDLKTVMAYAEIDAIRTMRGTALFGGLDMECAGEQICVAWSQAGNYITWMTLGLDGVETAMRTPFHASFVRVIHEWQHLLRLRPR